MSEQHQGERDALLREARAQLNPTILRGKIDTTLSASAEPSTKEVT